MLIRITNKSSLIVVGVLGIAATLRGPSAGAVDEAAWRVGLASVCITPDEPVWLHGYKTQARFRPFDGKLQDLMAKAMAIEDGEGKQALLITVDLCVLRPQEAELLFTKLVRETGLERSRILVNLSHTHSGPIIGTSDLHRYAMSDDERRRTVQYTEDLMDKLAEVAKEALARKEAARLSWGQGSVDFVCNRRQYDDKGHYRGMRPNPDKFVDRTVPVLRVDSPEGKLAALVFGCACHAVTLTSGNLKLSGDYPGYAQQAIEARHPGAQAMFVAGCGADANPNPRGTAETARRQGETLAEEVCRVAAGSLQTVHGPLRVASANPDLPLQTEFDRDTLKKHRGALAYNARRILQAMDDNKPLPTHHANPVAVWQFGENLTVVAIGGEVVSAYVPMLQQALGPQGLWVAGYSNEVDGYLPDAQIVQEGGYEARGLVADMGYYSAHAQDVVIATVRELARKAGRPLPE